MRGRSVTTSLIKMKNDGPLMNFRELGGYKTIHEKEIKKGYIFRGRALDNLDEKSIDYLKSLHLDYVFDLRDSKNQEAKPDYRLPGVKYISCPIIESLAMEDEHNPIDLDKIERVLRDGKWTKEDYKASAETIELMYQRMPFAEALLPIFEAMNEGKRIYIHCTGGKDRTGVACMLILWALGVPDKTILKDYRLSNRYRRKRNYWRIMTTFRSSKHLYSIYYISRFMFCSTKHFETVRDAVFSKYGNICLFFEKEYGINHKMIEKWKKFYTK